MLSIDENTHIHIVSLVIVVRDYSNRSNYNASLYVSSILKRNLRRSARSPSDTDRAELVEGQDQQRGAGLFAFHLLDYRKQFIRRLNVGT